jgi:hypothetical protein
VLVAVAIPEGAPRWMRLFALVATLVAAPLVVASDRCSPRLSAPFLAVSAVGLYWCVPDTEHARALVGAAPPVAVVTLDRGRRPDPAGTAAAVGLFVWTATVGGVGRPGSVIGGAACLGVLLIASLVTAAGVVVQTPVHIALVAVASRAGDAAPWVLLGLALAPAIALGVIAYPALAVIVVYASFPVGSVSAGGVLKVVQLAALVMAALVMLRRVASGRTPLPWSPPLWWALALLGWCLISLSAALDDTLAIKQIGALFGGIVGFNKMFVKVQAI